MDMACRRSSTASECAVCTQIAMTARRRDVRRFARTSRCLLALGGASYFATLTRRWRRQRCETKSASQASVSERELAGGGVKRVRVANRARKMYSFGPTTQVRCCEQITLRRFRQANSRE